ncbi:MAG: adenosylmethionine--8-amino-7-oxononanoate transaminase [Magnetococcales bacterium]|nr:adenosylmethionine--8-amino-7-oxononanoate transaminase [Magnetococcales bacterium]
MSRGNDLASLDRRHVWHPFTQEKTTPSPIPVVAAEGATLHGADGRKYLDLISSWWVTIHGHTHPAIVRAIADQAARLEQVIFAGFTHEPAVRLASRLAARLPGGLSRVFFSDNGSTAVEVALKMACQYWLNRGQRRSRFLAFEGGYHGDTVGAMSAGRTSGFFDAFETMLFHVDMLPYPATWMGDGEVEDKEAAVLTALNRYLDRNGPDCAGVIIEPLVQGASGMRMCRPEFLRGLAAKLKQSGIPLIFDEVMTGFGRTGALFACHKAGVAPDIICLSKGLTGGFMPLSVTVCREEIYQAFLGDGFDQAFAHGHSFTANPLGCAAALASLELFEKEKTLARVVAIERIHRGRVLELMSHPRVHRGRIHGSIAAVNIRDGKEEYASETSQRLKAFFLEKGLLIRPLGNVIYLLPPYCITEAELHRAWNVIEEGLTLVT